jgi:hypothetical protein
MLEALLREYDLLSACEALRPTSKTDKSEGRIKKSDKRVLGLAK